MPESEKSAERTILVVDDSPTVLHMVVMILERFGFRVLHADGPLSALLRAEQETETIDLLLSDVDMPSMSGPDLGQAMKKTRPNLKVMLMSGGANGNLLVLNYGWAFIQKPFLATMRIPAMPITHSNLMAITIPKHADHFRSEATLGCSHHRELIGLSQLNCV